MLAVESLRNTRDGCGEGYSIEVEDVFPDLTGDNLLESIDFDDLFDGMDDDEDALPALEIMEPDNNDVNIILSDGTFMFEKSNPHLADDDHDNNSSSITSKEEDDKVSSGNSGVNGSSGLPSSSCLNNQGDEVVSKRDESVPLTKKVGKKSSKNHQGKRKVKVDWTPELHRRFVQAVEQLGVDKAVPSRILELMGIDCLTRHNIASHLQKYRSHRKHLLVREAEAASWTHRRQMYGATTGAGGGGGCKRDITSPWLVPTIGFPPMAPVPHFRPLHVWGHPSMDQFLRHIWPKHLVPSPSPQPPLWPPASQSPHLPSPPDPASFWRSRHQRVPNALTPGTPCFPPAPLAQTQRFAAPPVQGIPPQAMYKVDPSPGVVQTAPTGQTCPTPPFDFHPSKESIDAAIEDVLSKPWLPFPLGLKPPSADSVVVELHRQGIEKLPTTCA